MVCRNQLFCSRETYKLPFHFAPEAKTVEKKNVREIRNKTLEMAAKTDLTNPHERKIPDKKLFGYPLVHTGSPVILEGDPESSQKFSCSEVFLKAVLCVCCRDISSPTVAERRRHLHHAGVL